MMLANEALKARQEQGGIPMFKTERQALVLIGKSFPELRGLNYGQLTSEQIFLAIMHQRNASHENPSNP